jgi:hypothetical protein
LQHHEEEEAAGDEDAEEVPSFEQQESRSGRPRRLWVRGIAGLPPVPKTDTEKLRLKPRKKE